MYQNLRYLISTIRFSLVQELREILTIPRISLEFYSNMGPKLAQEKNIGIFQVLKAVSLVVRKAQNMQRHKRQQIHCKIDKS